MIMQVEKKHKNDDVPADPEVGNDEALTAKGITSSEQLPGDEKKDTPTNLGKILLNYVSFSIGKGEGTMNWT